MKLPRCFGHTLSEVVQQVVSRVMPVADMKSRLGQGVLEQSPRVSVQIQSVGEHGKVQYQPTGK